jgi:hypothetical protein
VNTGCLGKILAPVWPGNIRRITYLRESLRAALRKAEGRETRAVLLVKRHADAFVFPPDDMAVPRASVRGHREHKTVRKPDRALDLDGRALRRDIADDTIDLAAAELDGPGFQDTVAR